MALGNEIRSLVGTLSELVAQHLALARLELAEDAQFVGKRLAIIAGLAPLILVGYGFVCVALALALRQLMAVELAFLAVGLLNLGVGSLAVVVAGRQLSARKVMATSLSEAEATAAVVLTPSASGQGKAQ